MENKKVTRNDLPIIKGTIEVDCVKIDGRIINLTQVPKMHIENYITHENCMDCGIEFKKSGTYDKRCPSCSWKKTTEKYYTLELVEWDGETPLCIFDADTYFSNEDDIISYCEDHDIKPSELMLVLCRITTFSTIDFEHWMDEVHEDWEASNEFEQKLKEFNEFLEKESTQTCWATNKRVDVSDLDKDMEDMEVGS